MHDLWNLSDCNKIWNHNHWADKQILKQFSETGQTIDLGCENLSVWLISCLPESQETPYSKQTQYVKWNWLQWGSNPQPNSL